MLYPASSGLRPVSSPFPHTVPRTGQEPALPLWAVAAVSGQAASIRLGRAPFVLLLLALCCSLILPAMALAGEKQAKATQRSVHKQGVYTYQKKTDNDLLKPTRWNVCRDMVKNLDLLQQSDASYSCELKFHPSMTQFSEPEWEELKLEDNWQLLYFLLKPTLGCKWSDPLTPFAKWQEQYIRDMQAGYTDKKRLNGQTCKTFRIPFHPRLRMTRVRFAENGPLITVIAYTHERNHENICTTIENKCHSTLIHPENDYYISREYFDSEEYKKHIEKSLVCKQTIEQKMGVRLDRSSMDYGESLWAYQPGTTWQPNQSSDYLSNSLILKPIENDFNMRNPDPTTLGPPFRLFLYKKRAYLASGYEPEFGFIHSLSRVRGNAICSEETDGPEREGEFGCHFITPGICQVERYRAPQ